MKKSSLLVTSVIKILIILVFGLFCYFDIFEMLDYRLYDALFHLKKEPVKNEKILVLKIDDASIKEQGEWPWPRDVIADALLRMKELGAYSAVFDIEYISPSKNGISPSAEEKISTNLYKTNSTINNLINDFSKAIILGYYTNSEIPALTKELIQKNINPGFDDLNDYIKNNMSRDNDEYFAQALQFFGKSYLTINNEELGYPVTDEEKDYVMNRFLIDSVEDSTGLIKLGNKITIEESKETPGFSPAMHKFISRAYGANFTNSVVDRDGVRRRMELIHYYDDKYDLQLAFGPYLELVKSHNIERKGDYLIVKDAHNPVTGKIEDVKIPVDEFGRLLINWRHDFIDASFNNDSIINLTKFDWMEEYIHQDLKYLCTDDQLYNDDGSLMEYSIHAQELLLQYEMITQVKEYLLSKCTGYDANNQVIDGISEEEYKQYFDLRREFFDGLKDFINQNYLETVIQRLTEISDQLSEEDFSNFTSNVNYDFSDLKDQYDTYQKSFTEMKTIYDGAYCFIGTTAVSTVDIGATPFDKKYMNVGIHANVLNTLLNQDFIVNIRWYWGFLGATILSLLMILLCKKSNLKQNFYSFILYLIYCLTFGALFVFSKFYIKFVGIIIFLLVDYSACVVYRFYLSVIEKRFITQVAASFANKDTVEELRKNPEAFNTKGQKKVITALFSDVQKFSTLSEAISKRYGDEGPNKLIEILNTYLGQMSNEILKNRGTIDKYEGDAIISMFGAPDPMNVHTKEEWAYLCLASAIYMKKVEVQFNEENKELFEPVEITNDKGQKEIIKLNPLQTRIGINSGEAFVGLMGSKTDSFSKLNYTMMGDTVNLASRLEGVNKAYASWIMCSDTTWNLANASSHQGEITARRLDQVRVVGRSTPVQLYNIIGFTNELNNNQKQQIEIFETAMDKYLQRDFANAGKLFMQCNSIGEGDPTALVFAERCKNFIENGIPEDWDGVINMTSK